MVGSDGGGERESPWYALCTKTLSARELSLRCTLHWSHAEKVLCTAISLTHFTVCCTEPTNQCRGKPYVGIRTDTGVLYGRITGVSLMDYILERRVTDVQSARAGGVTLSGLKLVASL